MRVAAASVVFLPLLLTAADADTTLDDLIAGIRTQRSTIKSGVYRVEATISRSFKGNTDVDQQVLTCVFDRERSASLYERERTHPNRKGARLHTVVLKTEKLNAQYCSETNMLRIRKPDSMEFDPFVDQPFDILALGMCFLSGLNSGLDYEQLIDKFTSSVGKPISVQDAADKSGRFLVIWHLKHEEVRWIVDTKKGFSPTRMERRFRTQEDPTVFADAPYQVQEFEWKRHLEVWVPTRYSVSYRQGQIDTAIDGKPSIVHLDSNWKWDVEWLSVNSPPDESVFDYQKLDLPRGTTIHHVR